MKNILITGSSGGIGTVLVNRLLQDGYKVTGIDTNQPQLSSNEENFSFFQGSINDDEFLKRINWEKIDATIHLAAISSLPECEFNPIKAFEENFMGTIKICEKVKKYGVGGIVFASTSAIYENNKEYPFFEDQLVNPHLIYSQTKQFCEKYLDAMLKAYKVPYMSLRFFNVIGPYQNYKRKSPPLVNYIVRELLNERQPLLHSDGKQERDYISVHDVCSAIAASIALLKDNSGIYNICSGELFSVSTLFEIIKTNLGSNLTPIFRESDKLWNEYIEQKEYKFPLDSKIIEQETNKLSFGNFDKFKKISGWEPKTEIREAIQEIIEISKEVMHAN
jgi:nucleoside-diphosphate-sugar epimerase